MSSLELEQIEKLYYKAIEDAKLDEPAGGDPGPPGYSTEDFSRWARKVDIFRLSEGAADFALKKHEEIVKEFGDYRRKVTHRLSKLFTFDGVALPGNVKDIGSCWDGSKVGAVNEMDSLYVMQGDAFTIQPLADKDGLHRVYLTKNSVRFEVEPRRIRDQFADQYSQIVSEVELPKCLQHGGYYSSRQSSGYQLSSNQYPDSGYSGVRYNGPAVTSQFLSGDRAPLTWDMTLAIVLDDTDGIYRVVRKLIQPIIADNPDKMFPPSDIHLIPDMNDNLWRRSTAQMEADMLRVLSREAPVKETLSFCKVLSSHVKGWDQKVELAGTLNITTELDKCLAVSGSGKTEEERKKLNKFMAFAHIWVPTERTGEYHENKKSNISINNAAVKHIIMQFAFQRKGAFSSSRNTCLVQKMMEHVFKVLGSDEEYSSEHALIPGTRISHFSVSPGAAQMKYTLAQDVRRQCRTLVQEAMTEVTPTKEAEEVIDDLNKSAFLPNEIRCGEYSFKVHMNPWQHPLFDQNIHHLLTALTSLGNGCGGVIYLIDDDGHTATQECFETFEQRLTALVGSKLELSARSFKLLQISLQLGMQRTWAVLILREVPQTLKYPVQETKGLWKPSSFQIDICGRIHADTVSETQRHNSRGKERSPVPVGRDTDSATMSTGYTNVTSPSQQTDEIPWSASDVSNTFVPSLGSKDDADKRQVDFSSYQRLDWVENTVNWEKYVRVKEGSINDVIQSCPAMWKPTQPMRITPSIDSIKYLFESEVVMEETFATVTTKEPGFAIVCRTWKYHIADDRTIDGTPVGHICDILTVTDTGRLSMWVVVSNLNEETLFGQVEYLMAIGRMLKYQISRKVAGALLDVWVDCRLLYITTSTLSCIGETVNLRLRESQDFQNHLRQLYGGAINFECPQQALAKVILSKESPLKRWLGDHRSITLSAQQAEVLMHKAKVNYITGPAGSGKSWTAVRLYFMYGKENSVYICTTNEFLEYLKFNGCKATRISSDRDLLEEIKKGTFRNKVCTCVIIDDCHNFRCTKVSMKKLFRLLERSKDMSLFVFADNDYQSFDRKRQQFVHNCILDLTRTILKDVPLNLRLTDIYRNTRKVVSFVQAAIQDVYDGHQKIESANIENGEGVECIKMANLWENSPANDLVIYLRSLPVPDEYSPTELAILLDSPFGTEDIEHCKQILRSYIPDLTFHGADVFPRTGVIVDSVGSFVGLDAGVVVFVLSNTHKRNTSVRPTPCLMGCFPRGDQDCDKSLYNPRFVVSLASRATHKAVFVIPEIHLDFVHQMKFDYFPPPVEFRAICETEQHRVQWGERLRGLFWDNKNLYTVEERAEGRSSSSWLCLYERRPGKEPLRLLDSVELGKLMYGVRPRVDMQTHDVYVLCEGQGVKVFRCEGGHLVIVKTLTCVKYVVSVAVNARDSIYVCDKDIEDAVLLVNVGTDKIVDRLQKPPQAGGGRPRRVAVLAESVLVCYGRNTVVLYSKGDSVPARILQQGSGLGPKVSSIATDGHSSFLLTDWDTVSVLDDRGNLYHRHRHTERLLDCAVVNSQLWLGCYDPGSVVVLTSQ